MSVTFDEYMDKAAAQAAFSLVRTGSATPVPGGFSWRGHTMTFRPAAALAREADYTATVSTGARDARGNALAAERAWGFRTLALRTAVPVASVVETGRRTAGTHSLLAADDDRFLRIASAPGGTRVSSWYRRFTGIPNGLRTLKVTERARSSAQCAQTVSIFNWTSRTWLPLDARAVGANETTVDRSVPGSLADYVSGSIGNGEVRVRSRCTRALSGFVTSSDLSRLTYERP